MKSTHKKKKNLNICPDIFFSTNLSTFHTHFLQSWVFSAFHFTCVVVLTKVVNQLFLKLYVEVLIKPCYLFLYTFAAMLNNPSNKSLHSSWKMFHTCLVPYKTGIQGHSWCTEWIRKYVIFTTQQSRYCIKTDTMVLEP